MIKKCRVILNNDAVTVFDFDGTEVQIPAICREAYTVNVKFDDGKYTVVPDDYEEVVETKTNEKPTKKTTEHKKVQLDEQKESD